MSSQSQCKLCLAAPGKTLTAHLQAAKTTTPAAEGQSGPKRSFRSAAAKSKSKQTAVEAVAKLESVAPAAAKTPSLLAEDISLEPATRMPFKVGCGSGTPCSWK